MFFFRQDAGKSGKNPRETKSQWCTAVENPVDVLREQPLTIAGIVHTAPAQGDSGNLKKIKNKINKNSGNLWVRE